MAGIRVNIPEVLLDKYETDELRRMLKVHFQDRRHGGSDIKEIHFPVLQYEAVIIYEESSVVDGVMRIEHTIDGKKLCIRRLPLCQIYRRLHTDLDRDMASIIQGCGIIDTLELELKLEMQYDKKKKTLIGFAGSWYQLEAAWNFIDSLMAQQKRMLLQNKLDELSYCIDGKQRHSRSAGLPSSNEDEDLLLQICSLDHEPRRIQQREGHINSEEDLNGLAVKAVESEHIAEKSSVSPSARLKKQEKKSLLVHANDVDQAVCRETPHDELLSHQNQNKKKTKMVDEYGAPQSLLSGKIEHIAENSSASSSGRQRKHEKISLSEHAIQVDKAVGKEAPCDELSPQQNQSQKKTEMVTEHDAPQSLLLGEPDLKTDHPNAISVRKEHTSKSSMCQKGGTYAVSTQMQQKLEYDTLYNLPRHEDVEDKIYRMQTKQCFMDNMDDSDGTPSLELHGHGFAIPDHSLPGGIESNARQRDRTENETFDYFASIKDDASAPKERKQNGGVTNSRSVINVDDSTEQDGDNFIGQSFQCEDSVIPVSTDLKIPQLEFTVGNISVVVLRGDITEEKSEVIVSSASRNLDNRAGIAKVIAAAAGNELQKECKDFIKKRHFLNITEVLPTSAGGHLNDKVTYVFHAAGPVWNEKLSSEETFQDELTTTYLNCFQFAEKRWLHSLSLPLISSGIVGVPIHLCVRSFIDGLLIFINNRERKPQLHKIHLINNDLEGTQLTIVILQQLLEMGLNKLTREALNNCKKKHTKKTTTTKPKRSSSLPRNYKRESVSPTNDIDKEAETVTSPRGRSSSVSRKKIASKPKETNSSASTQSSGPASTTCVISSQRTSSTSTQTSRSASAANTTSGRSERDQDENRSSFPSRTGRDGKSDSCVRPFSAGPSLKSTGSSKSQIGPQDGGSVGQTKNPPLIKQSLFNQEPTAASKKKEIGHLKREIAAKAKSQPLKAVHDSQDSDSNIESPRSPRGDNSDDSLGSPRDATSEKMFARRDLKPPENMFSSLPLDLEKPSHKSNSKMAATLPLGLSQRHVVERDTDTVCPICLELMHMPKILPKCNHKFCSACIAKYFKMCKPVCPQCGYVYGIIKGDQPKGGKMTYKTDKNLTLSGYEDAEGAIIITYDIPGGKQEDHHPRPGRMYNGLYRSAYLPNCSEGRLVLKLLQRAFDAGLIFTVGESKTTGRDNMITWNDIHHKTSIHGGSTNYGYPDPTYLQRVQEELAAKGITKDMV
ncbi:hypothetical protein CHS0354_036414 [Potamilus streckersoni]|uniref:RING-type E3 ubiquitin transferase n=1 Tax=Potamilus streckersoni TaxID=2493646 RepID=A0AAE0W362_9BIVA|nr:hypothetical protein CHS0354_036414 [Potamilus streckersoni]